MTQVSNTLTTIPKTNGVATPESAETEASTPAVDPPAAKEDKADVSAEPAAALPTEPKPEEDKHLELAKRFDGVAKKEAQARKLETSLQTKLAAIAEKEKALDAKIAEYDEALSDPIKWYLDKGKDPVEAAKRFAKPESEEAKRLRKLEDSLQKRDEQERANRELWEANQAAQRRYETLAQFVGGITEQECPNLTAIYEAPEVPRLVEELLNRRTSRDGPTMLEHFQDTHGRPPTDAEIKECLEYEAEQRATRILKRSQKAPDTQSPPEAQEQQPNSGGPSGISNQHAAPTSSGKPKPKSLDERRRKAREDLTAALETEASERRG